jgi:hypothetical protein
MAATLEHSWPRFVELVGTNAALAGTTTPQNPLWLVAAFRSLVEAHLTVLWVAVEAAIGEPLRGSSDEMRDVIQERLLAGARRATGSA